jgi:uncharacterized protein
MIDLVPHAEGVLLPVRAQPGARKAGLRGEQGGALKVCVTQIAEKGKANDAIVEALAKALGIRRSQIELVGGATSHQKRFLIRGMDVDEVHERIISAMS